MSTIFITHMPNCLMGATSMSKVFSLFIIRHTEISTIYLFIFRSFVMDHQYLYLDFNSMLQSVTVWLAELMLIILALLPDIVYRTYRDINYHITLGRVTQVRHSYWKTHFFSVLLRPPSLHKEPLCVRHSTNPVINRGFYMRAHVLLILLNELGEKR